MMYALSVYIMCAIRTLLNGAKKEEEKKVGGRIIDDKLENASSCIMYNILPSILPLQN